MSSSREQEIPSAPKEWSPDQPVRPGATKIQLGERFIWLIEDFYRRVPEAEANGALNIAIDLADELRRAVTASPSLTREQVEGLSFMRIERKAGGHAEYLDRAEVLELFDSVSRSPAVPQEETR